MMTKLGLDVDIRQIITMKFLIKEFQYLNIMDMICRISYAIKSMEQG